MLCSHILQLPIKFHQFVVQSWTEKAYLAGQLDFTTRPLVIRVFMQLHPVYQSLGELPKCPAFPFAFSGLDPGEGVRKERATQRIKT